MPNPFDPSNTAHSVHDTLEDAYAAIPPGKRRALIVDASTKDRAVTALYVERLDHGWSVALDGEWRGGAKVDGKVALLWAR